jgi:hypothetical protein
MTFKISNYDSMWLAGGIVIGLFFGVEHSRVFNGLLFGISLGYIFSYSIGYKHHL